VPTAKICTNVVMHSASVVVVRACIAQSEVPTTHWTLRFAEHQLNSHLSVPPSHIQPRYNYMGLLDTVCYPPIMYKAAIYFEKYIGSNATIKNVFDVPSEHGYVSSSHRSTHSNPSILERFLFLCTRHGVNLLMSTVNTVVVACSFVVEDVVVVFST
jgi:hypothetical protein